MLTITISTNQTQGEKMGNLSTYKNPWHADGYGPAFYSTDKKPMLTYRGVQVFKICKERYDYVMNGVCLTQRAGATRAREVINAILDGQDPHCAAPNTGNTGEEETGSFPCR